MAARHQECRFSLEDWRLVTDDILAFPGFPGEISAQRRGSAPPPARCPVLDGGGADPFCFFPGVGDFAAAESRPGGPPHRLRNLSRSVHAQPAPARRGPVEGVDKSPEPDPSAKPLTIIAQAAGDPATPRRARAAGRCAEIGGRGLWPAAPAISKISTRRNRRALPARALAGPRSFPTAPSFWMRRPKRRCPSIADDRRRRTGPPDAAEFRLPDHAQHALPSRHVHRQQQPQSGHASPLNGLAGNRLDGVGGPSHCPPMTAGAHLKRISRRQA